MTSSSERYIPKLASGEWIGCWSLTEPEAGSDAGGTRTKAVPDGDCWVLNGGKTFTTNAHVADVCVAMAVTDRAASPHGISAFIIEKGTPGISTSERRRTSWACAVRPPARCCSPIAASASQLCGKRGEGFVDSLRILDGGRISIAALSVGLAQGAYEAALKYSKQRKQFGRFISEFQAIQHKLADMATEIDAARLLTLRAAWLKDSGRASTRNPRWPSCLRRRRRCGSPTKRCRFTAATASSRIIRSRNSYRDVKLCTIGEGTSEIQRLVIARQLLKSCK